MKRTKLREILAKLYMGEIRCQQAETEILELFNLILDKEGEGGDQ